MERNVLVIFLNLEPMSSIAKTFLGLSEIPLDYPGISLVMVTDYQEYRISQSTSLSRSHNPKVSHCYKYILSLLSA